MQFIPTAIPDVILVNPVVFGDERGFFMETWERRKFAEGGIDCDFVQDNHSRSVQGTLRGLHYQIHQPQGKLVRVTAGAVFDVAVDLRRGSSTFGHWASEHLSAENKHMLWVPPGFAHGFYVTSETADFQYKCTDYYAPEHERCIRWDDLDLGIDWPLAGNGEPLVSEKDRNAPKFADVELYDE
ncbi:dTDP-4-dehydrorhamnose 3,5-epimerase [Spiribacter vilamensis]|uniref:dTDP-4-dehydrorhamnose 3,5-epimerase n=1 Tax=Spiribacter vilamensis TaxID=531306 RepID=A0A4Q8D172_9GAMM|nr:dTDP-4-dehydrorhamnose 3,5-epimerase [Spiribacter vilamensis]RZU99106.1 dTDP-4-dehydrorhamnose 3,5-epimerase [Spiribacter vilamensis]TVO61897.1 dTDP-4-dehydrorhamnose 3,5-epimerase [Spiribacter vilamensis]